VSWKWGITVSDRFAASEILNKSEDIWDNIRQNIKTSDKESPGLHEIKQRKPWFDEECSSFLDQRKQAKMHWLQDPNRRNVENLNRVRHKASRHFRNKKN